MLHHDLSPELAQLLETTFGHIAIFFWSPHVPAHWALEMTCQEWGALYFCGRSKDILKFGFLTVDPQHESELLFQLLNHSGPEVGVTHQNKEIWFVLRRKHHHSSTTLQSYKRDLFCWESLPDDDGLF
jgi:hypothetical protein